MAYYGAVKHSFSKELEKWLKSPGKKTLSNLEKIFGEKSFAIAFLILMSPAALPLPTGGITHVFEIIVMLLALSALGIYKAQD